MSGLTKWRPHVPTNCCFQLFIFTVLLKNDSLKPYFNNSNFKHRLIIFWDGKMVAHRSRQAQAAFDTLLEVEPMNVVHQHFVASLLSVKENRSRLPQKTHWGVWRRRGWLPLLKGEVDTPSENLLCWRGFTSMLMLKSVLTAPGLLISCRKYSPPELSSMKSYLQIREYCLAISAVQSGVAAQEIYGNPEAAAALTVSMTRHFSRRIGRLDGFRHLREGSEWCGRHGFPNIRAWLSEWEESF